jgi:hypothetical protein
MLTPEKIVSMSFHLFLFRWSEILENLYFYLQSCEYKCVLVKSTVLEKTSRVLEKKGKIMNAVSYSE